MVVESKHKLAKNNISVHVVVLLLIAKFWFYLLVADIRLLQGTS